MTDIKKIFDEAQPPSLPQIEFVEWAYNKTLREILNECDREDWLLWILSKILGTSSTEFIYIKAKLADIIKNIFDNQDIITAIEAGLLYGSNIIQYNEYLEKKEISENHQKQLSIASINANSSEYLMYAVKSMAARWSYDDQGYSMYRLSIKLLNNIDENYPSFEEIIKPLMLDIIRENTTNLE